MKLANKTALVTGAGSGIGQAIATRFAAEGAVVIVAGRTLAGVAETVGQIEAKGGTAYAVEGDVSDTEAVSALVASALGNVGQLDILVNNAAKAYGEDVLQTDIETWDLDIAVVLRSVFLMTKAVLPGMVERGSGVILNISSVNGLTGLGQDGYSAAKAGLLNFTRNVAVRYGKDGIRVNSISPATIRTPIWNDVVSKDPQVFEELANWYPLGRVGTPEDVANAALFLASEEAAWITGENLNVDGGLMAGSYRMSRDLRGED